MRIVQAKAPDARKLAPLFDAYRVFYEQKSDLEAAFGYLDERLRRGESTVFMALNEDEKPVGFVQLYRSFDSIDLGVRWTLYDLFVDPGHRRGGVGRQLMERAAQLARDTGAVGLILSTATGNVAGQRLYESCGYIRDDGFYYYNLTFPARGV